MAIPRLILYRDAALADASGPSLQQGISVLVAGHRILAIRPTSNEGILHPDARIVDAGGSTIVPGMVDAHSHVTLPGGSHWIDRGFDAPALLLEVAEHNGDLLSHAGVRWARDVGSPQAIDPRDGRKRALALRVRERWRADPTRPKMRVAGTWIAHSGVLQPGLDIEADDGPALLAAAKAQLDDGADLLKLYLDGPKKEEAPWSAEDVRAVVEMAHGRGASVTAHSGFLTGARVGIDGGVDSLEHGFELDSDAVAAMARQKMFLVSTLAIFRSWASFSSTTTIRSRTRPPAGGCGGSRGSQFPERAREPEGLEVGRQLLLRWPDIVELRSIAVEGHAQRMRLVDRQRGAVIDGILSLPIVQVGPAAEEDHVVRACVHDVLPPTRRREGEIDDRLPRCGDGATVRQGERNRLRAIMALRRDPDLLVQHRMEGDRVPGAVREVPPSIRSRDEERGGDCGERPRHEDPLGPRHQSHMAAGLEGLQHLERLRAAEMEPLHDLLGDRRDGVLEEVIEDVLSHVLHQVM